MRTGTVLGAAAWAEGTGAKLFRFAAVGVLSTLLYAALTLTLSATLPTGVASVLAYCAGAAFSYAGHKFFTFVSTGTHRVEAPRFAVLTVAGLTFSFVTAALLSDLLGLPASVPVALNCVAVPALNFLILNRWVFEARYGRQPR